MSTPALIVWTGDAEWFSDSAVTRVNGDGYPDTLVPELIAILSRDGLETGMRMLVMRPEWSYLDASLKGDSPYDFPGLGVTYPDYDCHRVETPSSMGKLLGMTHYAYEVSRQFLTVYKGRDMVAIYRIDSLPDVSIEALRVLI